MSRPFRTRVAATTATATTATAGATAVRRARPYRAAAVTLSAAAVLTLLGVADSSAQVGKGVKEFGRVSVRAGVPAGAQRFAVGSPDLVNGRFPQSHWANAFGCDGGNQSLRLEWRGAPGGTRSFAVTMFDPDAPTGSGFWHWLVWDVPATATGLETTPPAGAVTGADDAGVQGYLGPCPPVGDRPHHYQINVYALDTPSLALPAATPAAVTAFSMSGHVIGHAQTTALAAR
ncbi:YbhB/YbcL family Raf kinase inhibitor-like protein [Kitasatospora fiedleri]|uniref:YbhB/YbcL family Raf kinase inhibitor-like protein n=1 Tax=Kitasatospora fiedleri TaxID=2991545 RepID=UPI00249A958B|nr:YbhB/YbcL family Raf kinase inhibitor-like protein [Kitasatospora fiedleri]